MCRILFAAKHSWSSLRMSRPLFVGSYLQVTWWAFGQWKGRKFASNDNNSSGSVRPFICRYILQNCVIKQLLDSVFVNDQGWDKCYQPQPSARLITLITSTLIIPDITKLFTNARVPDCIHARVPHKKWVIHVKLKSWLIYWLLGPTVPYLKINLATKRLPYFVAFPSGTDCQTTSSLPFFLRDSRARVKITPREKRRHAAGREEHEGLQTKPKVLIIALKLTFSVFLFFFVFWLHFRSPRHCLI